MDMQMESIIHRIHFVLEVKEMQVVQCHSGIIYHIAWATIQDTTQPGLNFHQEVVDNERIDSNSYQQ
jgi:hypothetical protein